MDKTVIKILMINMVAKPLILLSPNIKSIIATIIVVILASKIVANEL